MRVVAALGGNALLRRGEAPDAEAQEEHVAQAVAALVPVAEACELVVTHGNGPQVGVLALESAADPALAHPYPFDVVGAESQGMIGYWLLQALENALPGRQVASIVCQTVVDAHDPAFDDPRKFVGPVYDEADAKRLAAEHGWVVRPDGDAWRRVVASPEPRELVELPTIRALVDAGAVVVCAGGGGIPVVRDRTGRLRGVEAVIDKDSSAALLAVSLGADSLLILTDVAAIEEGFGTPHARPIRRVSVPSLRAMGLPSGSMGPKAEAACRFVASTGGTAAIGSLADAADLLAGRAGTHVTAG